MSQPPSPQWRPAPQNPPPGQFGPPPPQQFPPAPPSSYGAPQAPRPAYGPQSGPPNPQRPGGPHRPGPQGPGGPSGPSAPFTPAPPGPPSPQGPGGPPGRSLRGLTATAFASAGLAVLSAAAAVVVLVLPADAGEEPAATGQPDGATESAPADDAVDLTEGLEPFDPYANEDYYGVTWHDLAWVPPMPEGWEVFYQEEARAVDFSRYAEVDDRGLVNCGDLGEDAAAYPESFDDPEAWYDAELAGEAPFVKAGDEFELVAGPEYTRYRIDGQDAILVEFERHWTQYEDSEGELFEVDYVAAQAYLYIDLPEDAGNGTDPVTPVRCQVYTVSTEPTYYEDGLAAVLGIRLWLE